MSRLEDAVAIVLAAGQGTRMRSPLPKPLVPLAGRSLVLWELDSLAEAGVGRAVVVVGHGAEEVRAALPAGVETALQEVRDGTASAVACAKDRPPPCRFRGDPNTSGPQPSRPASAIMCPRWASSASRSACEPNSVSSGRP